MSEIKWGASHRVSGGCFREQGGLCHREREERGPTAVEGEQEERGGKKRGAGGQAPGQMRGGGKLQRALIGALRPRPTPLRPCTQPPHDLARSAVQPGTRPLSDLAHTAASWQNSAREQEGADGTFPSQARCPQDQEHAPSPSPLECRSAGPVGPSFSEASTTVQSLYRDPLSLCKTPSPSQYAGPGRRVESPYTTPLSQYAGPVSLYAAPLSLSVSQRGGHCWYSTTAQAPDQGAAAGPVSSPLMGALTRGKRAEAEAEEAKAKVVQAKMAGIKQVR